MAGGLLIAAGGIALGGGVIVLGLYLQSGQLAALGLIPLIGGPVWGYNYIKKSYNNRVEDFEKETDPSDNYRFVRFLPEYAWAGWAMKQHAEPFTAYKNGKAVLASECYNISSNINNVILGYFPDSGETPVGLKPRLSMGRAENPDSINDIGETELFNAIRTNDSAYVKEIIKSGADVNQLSRLGVSPLHAAVSQKKMEIAKLLLDNGANVDIIDSSNDTPLISAVVNEQIDFVKLLVSRGADVNFMRKTGWNPLHNAVYWESPYIVSILLENGARVNDRSTLSYRTYPAGTAPLQIAVKKDNKYIIDLLKKYGAKEEKE